MFTGLPSQYAFLLVCCFEQDCSHPLCKQGAQNNPCWYSGGPPVTHLPLPCVNLERPWGNESCQTCESSCGGHYKTEMMNVKDAIVVVISSSTLSCSETRIFQNKKTILQMILFTKLQGKLFFLETVEWTLLLCVVSTPSVCYFPLIAYVVCTLSYVAATFVGLIW